MSVNRLQERPNALSGLFTALLMLPTTIGKYLCTRCCRLRRAQFATPARGDGPYPVCGRRQSVNGLLHRAAACSDGRTLSRHPQRLRAKLLSYDCRGYQSAVFANRSPT